MPEKNDHNNKQDKGSEHHERPQDYVYVPGKQGHNDPVIDTIPAPRPNKEKDKG